MTCLSDSIFMQLFSSTIPIIPVLIYIILSTIQYAIMIMLDIVRTAVTENAVVLLKLSSRHTKRFAAYVPLAQTSQGLSFQKTARRLKANLYRLSHESDFDTPAIVQPHSFRHQGHRYIQQGHEIPWSYPTPCLFTTCWTQLWQGYDH